MDFYSQEEAGSAKSSPGFPYEKLSLTKAKSFFDSLVLSASGWRGVFGQNDEDTGHELAAEKAYCSTLMAAVFADYLLEHKAAKLALAMDTRPTGPAMADAMARIFLAKGLQVSFASVCAAPELMAWAKLAGRLPKEHPDYLDAFCYISASHNPPGHNGVKFGMNDGGVLPASETKSLIEKLKKGACSDKSITELARLASSAGKEKLVELYSHTKANKARAVRYYSLFTKEVSAASEDLRVQESELASLASNIKAKGAGLVIDMNGSARSLSIDHDFLSELGVKLKLINNKPGMFAHRIVPEGASLEPCRLALEAARKEDAAYILGYVPDCDGDRGNFVYWDKKEGHAKALEAQDSFALAVLAELAVMAVQNPAALAKSAVACNDASSLRIEAIASVFGTEVWRSETGEANVVGLAAQLREKAYTVRVLGEGSNGGVISHPARVRDPINTTIAILKLLCTKGSNGRPGPYRLWLQRSGQAELYTENFGLSDVLESLPAYTSTSVFEDRAALRVKSSKHSLLKAAYEALWNKKKAEFFAELEKHYGPLQLKVFGSSGFTEEALNGSFAESGSGGLKLCFYDKSFRPAAFLWLRGSGTEPVFRVMADVRGKKPELEAWLLDRHAAIVKEADSLI
ncbi:phosphoglucomutase [Spirochaetota bacterium]